MSVTSIQKYMVVSSPEDSTCDKKLTLKVCALAQILTPEFTGSLSTSIQYHLVLDSYKTESRMFFTNGGREMNGTIVIRRPGLQCQNSTISLQDCNLEDVSGVQVSLTASLEPVDSLWLLSPSSYLNASDLISFQMCEEGVNCEPNMSVQLTHSHLVIKDGASFSMFLSLHNMSMKAHQTRLRVVVPAGLSFRKANVSEASHWISLVCGDFTEQTLGCNVSHPLLKRGVRAVIQIMFSVVSNVSWAERIFLAVNVTSESDGNTTLFSAEDEVPVLYPLQVISRSLEDSTKYVPFTNHDEEETAVHRYQVPSD
ncbi:hypothetical protein GDO81_023059 [Engystomops pustulosus]|uniref:Integrin alpha second immunoglobulin-like domain-containing protein n=1 Tax=Engystomops pustulosus TaxID=76066 RepID=A0AAV6Z7J9_ENGPU|nr:hypothetical protein GDO81_023059 [Engystomops pustulosus]